jgi:hypothetical protein
MDFTQSEEEKSQATTARIPYISAAISLYVFYFSPFIMDSASV